MDCPLGFPNFIIIIYKPVLYRHPLAAFCIHFERSDSYTYSNCNARTIDFRCGHLPPSARSAPVPLRPLPQNLYIPTDAAQPGYTGNALESQANFSERRSASCSAQKGKPSLFVDVQQLGGRAFNNYLFQQPYCGWLRVPATIFLDPLFPSC
jgi:hypothetical protein